TTLVFLPDDDGQLLLHRVEEGRTRRDGKPYITVGQSQRHDVNLVPGPRINGWQSFELMQLLEEQAVYLDRPIEDCAQRLTIVEVPASEQGWRWHPLLGFCT